MGQDVEGMGCGERVICLCLTVCFGVAVFSTVNLVFIHDNSRTLADNLSSLGVLLHLALTVNGSSNTNGTPNRSSPKPLV